MCSVHVVCVNVQCTCGMCECTVYMWYVCVNVQCTCTVNTHLSATIRFQRIWRINEFGGLTGYSLVLEHCIGARKLWWIKRFGG